jgi:hypothetical protein
MKSSLIALLFYAFLATSLSFAADANKYLADDDLLLSPQQNIAMLSKAWNIWLTLDVRMTSYRELATELSTQSGLTIEVHPDVVAQFDSQSGRGQERPYSEAPIGIDYGYHRIRAQFIHFLGPERWTEAAAVFRGGGVEKEKFILKTSGPLPLPIVLEYFFWMHPVSYRSDRIVVGRWSDLRPELAITRSFTLRHPWGSFYEVTYNGEPSRVRLNLLDTYALKVLESTFYDSNERDFWDARSRGPDPTGAAERLRALKAHADVSFDEASRRLTITAVPETIDTLTTCYLNDLDQPSPEEARKAARQYARELVSGLVQEDTAVVVTPELAQAAVSIHGPDNTAAKAGRVLLRGAGLAGAKALIVNEATNASSRERIDGVLEEIYAERVLPDIRATAEKYCRLFDAGDLAAIRSELWTAARVSDIDDWKEKFEQGQIAARSDQASAARWLKSIGHEAKEIDLLSLTFQQYWARRSHVDPRVEEIALSGQFALIGFTAVCEVGQEDGTTKTERYPSAFSLVHHQGRWLVDVSRPMLDEHPIRWTAPDPSKTAPLSGSFAQTWNEEDEGGNQSAGAGAGAWAMAVNFGL